MSLGYKPWDFDGRLETGGFPGPHSSVYPDKWEMQSLGHSCWEEAEEQDFAQGFVNYRFQSDQSCDISSWSK